MLGQIRVLEEGEAVRVGTCSLCGWQGETIFEIGDEEREIAEHTLFQVHSLTCDSGIMAFKEEGEFKAPESYLNHRRPKLFDALRLEGGTTDEALASLKRKGYNTPAPRPWTLGFNDRGMGYGIYVVLDRFGDLVVEAPDRVTAEYIIKAVNVFEPK